MDDETQNRAKGWTLWKALIIYAGNKDNNEKIAEETYHVIENITDDWS